MYYIIQVLGRFAGYYDVFFRVGDVVYGGKLVSQILRKHFGENCKTVILVPESLVAMLTDDVYEAADLLRDKQKFERRVGDEIVEAGLLEEPFEILKIQSVGPYRGGSWHICFRNHFDNIVCYAFLELLKHLNGGDCRLIVDISTGQNLYVNSMVEAIRVLLVYYKLSRILQKKMDMRIDMVSTPPIQKEAGECAEYDVNFYEYDVKAFFEFPIRGNIPTSASNFLREAPVELKRRLSFKLRGETRILNKILGSARLAFNSLRYNTPLAMFYNDIISLDVEPNEGFNALTKILEVFEKERKIEVKDERLVVERLTVNRLLIMNTFLALSLYSSLWKFGKEVRLKKPTEKEIMSLFSTVYKNANLHLNARFLERDLKEIEEAASSKLKTGEKKRLSDLFEKKNSKRKRGRKFSDPKRNFYAHSGLLREILIVEKQDDELILHYDKNSFNTIRKWLKKPE